MLHISTSGICKLRQQWDATTHLLEWPNSKTLKTVYVMKMWNKMNSHSLLVGLRNGIAILCFFKKLNIRLPFELAILLHSIYPNHLKAYVYTKICTWDFLGGPVAKAPHSQCRGPSQGTKSRMLEVGPLSSPQIHQKIIWTLSKFHRTTCEC